MVTKDDLKKYAEKLMFEMKDEEYDTLLEEFDVILKQMDIIGEIENISDVEPMTFPYELYDNNYSDDNTGDVICRDDVLLNAIEVLDNQIKVPKVVGE